VIPANVASRRLFEKLGYQIDDSPGAREFIDEESDLTMSLARSAFEPTYTAERVAIRAYERSAPAP
jgi:RimJ/RimL family protein N-acetyltransferase